MATDERKVVGYTINEEIPVVTLLKVAIELGEITDMRTTYHPEYHSKTVEIYYFPHTYWTPAQEPITQVPSTTVSTPILSAPTNQLTPTTPINQSTVPNSDQYENKQTGPTGLADIQVHRPGHQLMVTLTYRSAEIKQQTLIYLRNEKKRAPREEKQASPRPPTKQHEAEVDINRLHILMPRGMSKEEAIDILAECGPIDHLDFVAMGPKKYNLQAIFIRYCTEEGATRAKRSDRFRGEIRHAKGQTIPAPFRNLPKWFHCIYCGHQATSFRRRDHDAICARQMAVEEESYWKGPELKANSIINFKTHYFCGRGIDRTAWADHTSNPRMWKKIEIPENDDLELNKK
ncbi:unnamed protein product, partial [Trichogramma brassicae]